MTVETALRDAFTYNPETGDLFASSGNPAGCLTRAGYRQVSYKGEKILAHRLAFLLVTGEWPCALVDHINGIRSDNRWCNLRAASRAENQWNRKLSRDSLSGVKGVSSNASKWRARLLVRGRLRHLGTYSSPEEAGEVVRLVRDMLHGNFARHG